MVVPLNLRLSIFVFVALVSAAAAAQSNRVLGDSAQLSGKSPQSDSAGRTVGWPSYPGNPACRRGWRVQGHRD